MDQVCGTHSGPRVATRRPRGLRALGALALCAGLLALAFCGAAARAAGAPPRRPPEPGNLWQAYPLDAGPKSVDAAHAKRAGARSASSSTSSRSSLLLWIALAALGASAVAFAVWWRRSGRQWPLATRLAAEHGFVLAAHGPRLFSGTVRGAGPVDAEVVAAERPSPNGSHAGATRGEVTKLKQKQLPRLQERKEDDVGVLKAKLAGSTSRSPTQRPAPAAPSAPLRTIQAKRCRVVWWRGYVKSEFQAQLLSPGHAVVVRRSPAFRWSKAEPPPAEHAEASQAHAALKKELEAAGWVVARRGKDWYAIEFERRLIGGGRGRAEHEQ
jgi:hypothetical protein